MSASIPIVPKKGGERTLIERAMGAFPFGLYVAGAMIFFRGQIFSNFDLGFGDIGDARLVIFLHEHVYRWLYVHSGFLSPPFFFNQTNTLGYSDAFLLDQIIYAPLRLLGADPLLAASLVTIILSPIAYFFLYLFLRRLDVSVPMASLAAFIFTFANNLYVKSGHLQHFAIYYIPIIVYCSLRAVGEVHRRPIRSYLFGTIAAGLYGLLFSTGYYMAWFFGLGLLIFAPIVTCLAWPQLRAWWHKGPQCVLGLGLAASLGFLAALSIFALIYAPVLATGAVREFSDYLYYAPQPIDIVNVGSENLVWSGLTRSLHLFDDKRPETRIALTPIVQILLLSSLIFACRSRFWPASDSGRIARAFVIAGAGACILLFLVTIQVHDFSLFRLLYAIVPGANAIRAGYRSMVVANLFAVTAIALSFDRLIRLSLLESRISMRRGRLVALTALLSLAAIEQLNVGQAAGLSRKDEHERIGGLGKAPRECRTFYVAPEAGLEDVYVQIDGMMIALAQNIPTINGHSGLLPPDWDLYNTDKPDYEQRTQRWALSRGIAQGLCRADIDSGAWTVVPVDPGWSCRPGVCVRRISLGQSHEFQINLGEDGNGALFTDEHWQEVEPDARWTAATQATLSFSVGPPRDLVVSLSARPLLSDQAPRQSLWVEANQCRVASTEFDFRGPGYQTITGAVPASCVDTDGRIVLRINTDRVRSPLEIGISDHDTRKLGIYVQRVLIRETVPPEH